MTAPLTVTRLRRLLDYDPASGRFTWRTNGRGRFMRRGARAGTICKSKGLRQICVDGVCYLAGPLAVFWTTGRWPRRLVNHKNGISDDDRWINLRLATHSQNAASSHPQFKTLAKGVTWDKSRKKYAARIKVKYRTINLGRFDDANDAHAAYCVAASKHFGGFARTGR